MGVYNYILLELKPTSVEFKPVINQLRSKI